MKREDTELNTRYESLPDSEKKKDIKEIEDLLHSTSYAILPNRYPYWIDDELVHKIIWVNSKYKKYVIPEKVAIEHLLQNGYKDFVLFCNSRDNKSIPSVTHYHVIYLI